MLKKRVTKSTSTTNSHKTDLNKVRKDFQSRSGGGDGEKKNWLKIEAAASGTKTQVKIRILPAWSKKAEGNFYWLEAQHFGFMVGGYQRAITCTESLNLGPCAVCKFIGKLKQSDDKNHLKLGDRLRANWRYFMNVYDRADKTVKMWGTSKKMITELLDKSEDMDIDFTDVETGHDVIITRRGSTFKNTRYSLSIRQEESVVKVDLKKLYQLDKDVNEVLSPEKIMELLKDNYLEEMQEVGMKSGKTKPKLVKKAKPAKDEDEDEEDNEEEEEEDTEDTDNEEEDESDDDEEDEESDDEDEDDE